MIPDVAFPTRIVGLSALAHGALAAALWLVPGGVRAPKEERLAVVEFGVTPAPVEPTPAPVATVSDGEVPVVAVPARASPRRSPKSDPATNASGDPFAVRGRSVGHGDGVRINASGSGSGEKPGTGTGTGSGSVPVPVPVPVPGSSPDPDVVAAAVQDAVRYPRMARERGLEGRVVVRFRIDDEGMAREITVTRSAGELLDEAAVEAVKRAQPFPTGAGLVVVPVRFVLSM
jgi:protein TonB